MALLLPSLLAVGCVPAIQKPGAFVPVDREIADLRRAHAQGLLSDAELAEFDAMVRRQQSKRWPDARIEYTQATVPMRIGSLENIGLIEHQRDR